MPIDFSTYIAQLNESLSEENGPTLAYLLRPTSPHGKDLVKEFRNPTVIERVPCPEGVVLRGCSLLQRVFLNRYKGSMVSPWDEIAIQYVLVCTHVAKRRPGEAFQEHSTLVS
jgi:COP9 signalosome complex subunit 12